MKAPHWFATASLLGPYLAAAILAGCSSSAPEKGTVGGAAGRPQGGAAGLAAAGSPGMAISGAAGSSVAGSDSGANTGAGSAGTSASAGASSTAGSVGIAGAGGSAGSPGSNSLFTALSATVSSSLLRGALPIGTEPTTISFRVTIVREGSEDGAVNVSLTGLPPGTTHTPQSVAPRLTSAGIDVKIASTAMPGGPHSLQLIVSGVADPTISYKLPLTLYIAQAPGSLDSSFGDRGVASIKATLQGTEATVPADRATSVAIDESGRTILGGSSTGTVGRRGWLMRLVPDGSLDAAFGKSGKLTEFGQAASVDEIALAGDRVYAAVSASSSIGSGSIWYVRKLLESGGIDPTFNEGLDVSATAAITAMIPFKGGLLVAPGAPALITGGGKLDTTFTAPTAMTVVRRFAADKANDKVLVAEANTSGSFRLARLLSNGASDPTWGTGSAIDIPCPSGFATASALAFLGYRMSRNEYVVFATCTAGGFASSGDASLYVFTDTGVFMDAIGPYGKRLMVNPGQAIAAAIQSDGRILALYASEGLDARGNPVLTPILKRFDGMVAVDTSFAQAGILDLGKVMPGILPTRMAYDAKAQRVVLIGDDIASGGLRLVRIWL